MGVRSGILVTLAACLICFAQAAAAKTRALVVGVSGYPALAEALHLNGPRTDAREMANALVRFGIPADAVTVLADGVERLDDGISGSALPTKAAILDALDGLAATSAPGDLVVFYFSGHGTQQPDLDGDELGGQDAVFLPYDAGKWAGGGVENGILDDELRVRVEAILDRGADFFGIIDACHSSTGFRMLEDDDVRARQVPPDALGIPETAAAPVTTRSLRLGGGEARPGRGRAAYFYAAQETEVALERKPRGVEDAEVQGVFTFNLLRRLNQNPNITYRTLHDAVVSDIKRGTLMATQTPEMEGELLDEPVMRLGAASVLRQWQVRSGKLQAGQLHGLSSGALLSLHDDAMAGAPLGFAVVEAAGASQSEIAPADGTDAAALRKARYARLVEPGVDLTVALSRPVRIDRDDGYDYAHVLAAFEAATALPQMSARVSTRDSGYDVAVALVDGKLAFAPAGGMVDQAGPGSSPRLTLPDGEAAAAATVASAIERIARATALHRLADALDADGAAALTTEMLVARTAEPVAFARECPDPFGDGYGEPERATGPPVLHDCDVVSLALRNDGNKPLDVTVLLVGADFSITPLWPDEGVANRIHPSETRTLPLLRMEPEPDGQGVRGEERLVVIAVPGSGRSHTAFDSFAQEGLRAAGDDADDVQREASALIATGLNDMSAGTARSGARLREEISIGILPFFSDPSGAGDQ